MISGVRVSSFETNGAESVTYYNIDYIVDGTRPHQSQKRYTDVARFCDSLRASCPELQFTRLHDFRFPRKSVFNTHSGFTKERRREVC